MQKFRSYLRSSTLPICMPLPESLQQSQVQKPYVGRMTRGHISTILFSQACFAFIPVHFSYASAYSKAFLHDEGAQLIEAPPTALKPGEALSMLPAVLSNEIGLDPRPILERCAAGLQAASPLEHLSAAGYQSSAELERSHTETLGAPQSYHFLYILQAPKLCTASMHPPAAPH